MTRVYLSGPIVDESRREDTFYRTVVVTLEEMGLTVFAPQFLPSDSPDRIFERDTNEVRLCDVLVAEVSSPSHGVGMEVMLAVELMKPVLMFSRRGSQRLSCMLRGATGKALIEYSDISEVRSLLQSLDFDSLIVQRCPGCGSQVAQVTEDRLRCVACGRESVHLV